MIAALLAQAALAAGLVLPDPEHIIVLLGAIGLGVGLGLGSGYAAFLSRSSSAKIEAFKAWDEAHRHSTQAKLEEALKQHDQAMEQIQLNAEMIQKMNVELAEERRKNDRLAEDLVDFAKKVLVDKGYLTSESPPHAS